MSVGDPYPCYSYGPVIPLGPFYPDGPTRYLGGPSGWVCPKCGAVHAPFQAFCVFCLPKATCAVKQTS